MTCAGESACPTVSESAAVWTGFRVVGPSTRWLGHRLGGDSVPTRLRIWRLDGESSASYKALSRNLSADDIVIQSISVQFRRGSQRIIERY